jgi:hypothetical protein
VTLSPPSGVSAASMAARAAATVARAVRALFPLAGRLVSDTLFPLVSNAGLKR